MGKTAKCNTCGRTLQLHKGGDCQRCCYRRGKGLDPLTGLPQAKPESVAYPAEDINPVVVNVPPDYDAQTAVEEVATANPEPVITDQAVSTTLPSPLDKLLTRRNTLLEIPHELSLRLCTAEIGNHDIITLIELLLDGHLMRVDEDIVAD